MTAFNLSGNQNHGTLTNDPAWVGGRAGPALDFDGGDDYVLPHDNGSLDLSEVYTIAGWIYPHAIGGASGGTALTIYANYNDNNASPWNGVLFTIGGAFCTNGGQLRLFHNDDDSGTFPVLLSGTNYIVTNQWQHVAATLDSGDTARLYIDGVEVNNGSISETASFSSASPKIGRAHNDSGTSNPYEDFDGLIDVVQVYDRALSAAEIAQLYANPFCMIKPPRPAKHWYVGVTLYTLEAGADSYAITGQAAATLYHRALAASAESYAVNGQTASLLKHSEVDAGAGSYTLTGQAASVLYHREVDADAGSYAISGQAVSTLWHRLVSAGVGSYVSSGQAASLLFHRLVSAGADTYALSGQDVILFRGRTISADSGSYALSGQIASLLFNHRLSAEIESYTVNGQDAILFRGRTMVTESGTYALTGQISNLLYWRVIIAGPDVYALTGLDADLLPIGVAIRRLLGELVDVSPSGHLIWVSKPGDWGGESWGRFLWGQDTEAIGGDMIDHSPRGKLEEAG